MLGWFRPFIIRTSRNSWKKQKQLDEASEVSLNINPELSIYSGYNVEPEPDRLDS